MDSGVEIDSPSKLDVLLPILLGWTSYRQLFIPVPEHEYVKVIEQYVLRNCPEFVTLTFYREGLTFHVEKIANHFICQWNKLGNLIMKPFASKTEGDKCFLSSHDLHQFLLNTFQEEFPLITGINCKRNEAEFGTFNEIEFIPYPLNKNIEKKT